MGRRPKVQGRGGRTGWVLNRFKNKAAKPHENYAEDRKTWGGKKAGLKKLKKP